MCAFLVKLCIGLQIGDHYLGKSKDYKRLLFLQCVMGLTVTCYHKWQMEQGSMICC